MSAIETGLHGKARGLFAPPPKSWRVRAAVAAVRIEQIIRAADPVAVPMRSDNGVGLGHALWMAGQLQLLLGAVDSETKACRWLGYLQAMLVYEDIVTLDEMKELNRSTGKDDTA